MTPPGSDPQPALSEPMHNGRDARQLASDAERSLRGIVHLAESSAHVLAAQEIHGVLSSTARLLEQVPEIVTRLRAMVLHEQDEGRLRIAAGPYTNDPAAAADAFAEAVDAILPALAAVATKMSTVAATASDASFVTPE